MTPLKFLAALLLPTLTACGDGQSLTKQGDNNNLAERTDNKAQDGVIIPEAASIADFQVKISQIAGEPCNITEQRDDGLLLACSANNEHYTLTVDASGHPEIPSVLTVDVATEDGTRLIACEDGVGTSEPDASSCLLRLVRVGNTYTGSVQVEGPAVQTPALPDPVKEATDLIDQAGEGTAEVKDRLKQTAEQIPAASEVADDLAARAVTASQLKRDQVQDSLTHATSKVRQAAGATAERAKEPLQAARSARQDFAVKISDLFRNKAPLAARQALERMGRIKS